MKNLDDFLQCYHQDYLKGLGQESNIAREKYHEIKGVVRSAPRRFELVLGKTKFNLRLVAIFALSSSHSRMMTWPVALESLILQEWLD